MIRNGKFDYIVSRNGNDFIFSFGNHFRNVNRTCEYDVFLSYTNKINYKFHAWFIMVICLNLCSQLHLKNWTIFVNILNFAYTHNFFYELLVSFFIVRFLLGYTNYYWKFKIQHTLCVTQLRNYLQKKINFILSNKFNFEGKKLSHRQVISIMSSRRRWHIYEFS